MNAPEIKRQLEARWEEWVRMAAPSAAQKGKQFFLGSPQGEEGQSCQVFLGNQGTHIYHDKASGESGDIIALYAHCHGVTYREALGRAREFLGVHDVEPVQQQRKPEEPPKTGVRKLKQPHLEYLNQRKISDATSQVYKLASQTREGKYGDQHIVFPFFDTDGDLTMLKSLGIERGPRGKKEIWTSDPWYTLFGWHAVSDDATEIIITEGEVDALSLFELGFENVLSIPNGVSNTRWIETDYQRLRDFSRISLCFDSDEPGRKAAKEVAERLGRERTFLVSLPEGYKDANDYLVRNGDKDRIKKCLEEAKTYDPPTIQEPEDILEEAIQARKQREELMGVRDFCLPIEFIQLPGEITILEGYSFHGKSDFAYQMAVNDLERGHKVMAVSFEIPSSDMFTAMAQSWAGKGASDETLVAFKNFSTDKLWYIGDENSHIGFQELREDIKYVNKRFGIDRILIDSLHFLASKGDYEGQDKVILGLKRLAAELRNIHITVIAHARYGDGGESRIPAIDDIEGSKGMVKVAQNILALWRNRKKEETLQDSAASPSDKAKVQQEPDAKLRIHKQRNGFRRTFSSDLVYDFLSRRFDIHHGDFEDIVDRSTNANY